MNKKLGIIVPYRNRHSHLKQFLDKLPKYLDNRSYNYQIIIVQQDNASAFNRGMLCNIGFQEAKKLKCDYVVFHDVDTLPIDIDYSYANHPIHLATDKLPFDTYFGGITLFPVKDFEKVDGFSNLYWGWGFEDDDLMYRCIRERIPLERSTKKFSNKDRGTIKLNGENAYITAPNTINYRKNFTLAIRVTLEKLTLDHTGNSDIFEILNIEGYDFSLNYSSFKRFSLQFFDSMNNFHQIYSNIYDSSQNLLAVTYDYANKTIKFFIDGISIGSKTLTHPLKNYGNIKDIFLGATNKLENYFNGSIENFYVFNKVLGKKELASLNSKFDISPTSNYEDYVSSRNLKAYYDSRFMKNYRLIDLTGNKNDANIYNAYITKIGNKSSKIFYAPKRRDSKIKFLKHDDNGFIGGRWKDDLTRWNQLRFTNEVLNQRYDNVSDGLSSLQFTLHGRTKKGNVVYLNVGI